MELVVSILKEVLELTEEQPTAQMLETHRHGAALFGPYDYDRGSRPSSWC